MSESTLKEIVDDLTEQIQMLEDLKTQVIELQEETRGMVTGVNLFFEKWKRDEERDCEDCHRTFRADETIETEFGFLCRDCFRDRIQIEDKEIYE